ncbi:MAG: transcriptional repressor LexA [SAR86 cluster bacterium]|jgi:repressor LexA|nr:transcriptional repressor LexA [SAR86 cluster bacterium]|tara:strand:- start:2600 stop:3202 length:603 start_codon:yes stop_codon:yes gene_type:complete
MKDLTSRQREILELIKSHLKDKGFPPTRADISRTLGFKSHNAAEQHLRAIEKKGFISILAGASRGIVLNEEEKGIPVIGLVAAGGPILAQENIEKRIPASQSLLSENVDYYLRVKGDSMVDVGIFEEDLIGVKKTNDIKVGSVVVARINDEVTVKTLKKLSLEEVILKAENENYSDIKVNPSVDELNFEGTCVGLLRNLS